MALIIDNIQTYMDSYGDPRTKDWPMMSSPFPTLLVCLGYVYIVKVVGPKLMENRKPFHLQNTLIIYNFVQVIFSAWLFYECLMGGWWGEYSFRCQPVDHSTSPTATRMVHACWWYYFSKFTEFMDTIFFILRKKTSQVSTLHVIHHGCMPMSVWFGVKFTPGGHSTFFGLLNTFVHIVMYTYYLFAAMGPQYQKYLWWKKYLTALQMIQFIAIMVHAFQLLFIDCNYPKAFVWWIGMHAVMFFFLFNEFYKSTYKAKLDRQRREKQKALEKKEQDDRIEAAKLLELAESELNNNNNNNTNNNNIINNHHKRIDVNGFLNGLNGKRLSNGHISSSNHNSNSNINNNNTNNNNNNNFLNSTNSSDLPTELIQRKLQ